MKTITDDPEGFFAGGGWNFLNSESDVSSIADRQNNMQMTPYPIIITIVTPRKRIHIIPLHFEMFFFA